MLAADLTSFWADLSAQIVLEFKLSHLMAYFYSFEIDHGNTKLNQEPIHDMGMI
jgi:hypothetical protein